MTPDLRLNLGCGDQLLPGFVNVDNCGTPDLHLDLSRFPWPWETDSVGEVYCAHFLEHVDDYGATIQEIHRILAPGGTFHFRVPHFRSPLNHWHLHKETFSVFTPEQLCRAVPYQWGGRQLFRRGRIRLSYPSIRRPIGRVLEALANLGPLAWDWQDFPPTRSNS